MNFKVSKEFAEQLLQCDIKYIEEAINGNNISVYFIPWINSPQKSLYWHDIFEGRKPLDEIDIRFLKACKRYILYHRGYNDEISKFVNYLHTNSKKNTNDEHFNNLLRHNKIEIKKTKTIPEFITPEECALYIKKIKEEGQRENSILKLSNLERNLLKSIIKLDSVNIKDDMMIIDNHKFRMPLWLQDLVRKIKIEYQL